MVTDCCDHAGRDEHGCWDCYNTGHAHDPSRPCDTVTRYGNRGLGGWQCTCGRFAKFIRWQNTGAPGYERGYVVNCKRCGEVMVF